MEELRDPERLLHTLIRIPRSLFFAHEHDLPEYDKRCACRCDAMSSYQAANLFVVGRLDRFLPLGHHFIELLHNRGPLLRRRTCRRSLHCSR